MASLGSLVLELAANTARLQSDMGKAVGIVESGARKMKGVFTALGFAGGGGLLGSVLVGAAKQAIEFGDSINKASIKSGIGVKAMSELAYAAKLADVDLAALSTGIKKMQIALSEAGNGAKEPTLALKALGVTVTDLQKRKPEAQFELLADRISKLTDPADKARAATELFGKAGADLLPLFEQGASGIAKAREEAEKLGVSFGDEQIKSLSNADDSIKRLDASWKGFATTLTAAVAPALAGIFDSLSGLDTRSVTQQIAALDKMIQQAQTVGFGPGVDSQKALAGLIQQRSQLVGRGDLEQIRALQTGTSGGPTGRIRTLGDPSGFAALGNPEADKSIDKLVDKFSESAQDITFQLNSALASELDDSNQSWAEQLTNWQEFEDARLEAEEETSRAMSKLRDEQAMQLSDTAQLWKTTFLNAFDDMVNTGKIKWGELLKFMAAEIGRNAISKAFDSAFSKGNSGNGFGSILNSLFGGIFGGGHSDSSTASWVADFAGARANGGPVMAGKTYRVNERGMEFFRPNVSGNVIPIGGGGGGGSVIMNQHNTYGAGLDIGTIQRMQRESLRQFADQLDRAHALQGT